MAELRVKGTGTIKLFENDNTSNITIASPASLGADRTITLPDASVTLASGTMLATDGSGASLTALNASELGSGTVPTARLGSGTASSTTILYGDQTYKTEPSGGANTPNFNAVQDTIQAIAYNTWTRAICDTEQWDTGSLYNTTTGRFTVDAAAAGKYFFYGQAAFQLVNAPRIGVALYLNGSGYRYSEVGAGDGSTGFGTPYPNPNVQAVITLVDGDYVEMWVNQKDVLSGSINLNGDDNANWFGGFRLIE